MRAHISCFWTQKNGNEVHEYEDAYAVADGSISDDGDWDSSEPLRLALADGASESFLAGRWAVDLTARYAAGSGTKVLIRKAVAAWPELLAAYCDERAQRGKPLMWFEETKMQDGAHATLVTGRFVDRPGLEASGYLDLTALGDACSFGVRDDELILSFPMTAAEDFGTSPSLIQSRPRDVELTVSTVQRRRVRWESGDAYYFATDALSHWFLATVEAGGRPWEALRDLGTDDAPAFEDWVAGLRASGEMHNDDVSLLRVDVL